METLAGLAPQMMPYYQDKSPRPVYKMQPTQIGKMSWLQTSSPAWY